ncbi:hypothetical protein HWV62_31527 [Athelia sp. TMB]|nr:hypothetical protein HWV62_31527 [Athelia sp. TMB]
MTSTPRHKTHTIYTPRLILRSAVLEDAEALASLFSNPANSEFEPHKPDSPTAEKYEIRIAGWEAATAKGESAFMVFALRDQSADEGNEGDAPLGGRIIGMGGFNALPFSFSATDPSTKTLVGDTGVMIDSSETRKGYAREALAATIEYGFETLQCDRMFMETLAANVPFNALMKAMGLEDVKKEAVGKFGAECVYEFGREVWKSAKKTVADSGKLI